MPAFPSWVKYDWRDLEEAPGAVVERTEMDRGRPKQRRVNSDARVEIALTLHFDSKAQQADFETWFYTDINAGQDYFDLAHPRSGATVVARVVGGQLGALSFLNSTREVATRSIRVEYWLAAY
jgi:hypothetical protein